MVIHTHANIENGTKKGLHKFSWNGSVQRQRGSRSRFSRRAPSGDYLVTLTVDGNNPLCGRHVVFTLEVLDVREATPEEMAAGGTLEPETQDVAGTKKVPL